MDINDFNIFDCDKPYFTIQKIKYYIGTVITRKSTSSLTKHFGVFVGIKNNKILILHFDGRGILLQDINEYLITSKGKKFDTFNIKYPIYEYNVELLNNINNSLKNNKKRKFHAILNNCEIFVEKTVFNQNNYSKYAKYSMIIDIFVILNNFSKNKHSLNYFNKKIKQVYKLF